MQDDQNMNTTLGEGTSGLSSEHSSDPSNTNRGLCIHLVGPDVELMSEAFSCYKYCQCVSWEGLPWALQFIWI